MENTFQDPQWMPKNMGSTEPYVYYVCLFVFFFWSDNWEDY